MPNSWDIDWRSASTETRLSRQSQGDLSVTDCRPGYILFLKAEAQVDRVHAVESCLPAGALDHPALVLEASGPNHLHICPLTSFGGRSLDQRFPHSDDYKANYLPIAPSPAALATMPQISMEGPLLPKKSHVDIRKAYRVHVTMLRLHSSSHPSSLYQLSAPSLALVRSKLINPLQPEQASMPSSSAQSLNVPDTHLAQSKESTDKVGRWLVPSSPGYQRGFRPNYTVQAPPRLRASSRSDKLQRDWRSWNRPTASSFSRSSCCAA